MIGVWLTLEEAEHLLRVHRRDKVAVAAVKQIRAQLRLERLLPHDHIPEMSIRFRDLSEDVFGAERAEALWAAWSEAVKAVDRKKRKSAKR